MTNATGSAVTNFPQTTDNPTLSERVSELVENVGGTVREDHKRKAAAAYRRGIRRLNLVPWTFRRADPKDFTLVASQQEYTLTDKLFRNGLLSQLVDSSDNTREWVPYIEWKDWGRSIPDQSTTGASPILYTHRNTHSDGKIIMEPIPGASITWPTFRLFYHQRIPLLSNDNDRLAAPMEVEELCYMWAEYYFVAKVRTRRDARELGVDARDYEVDARDQWQDWEDS